MKTYYAVCNVNGPISVGLDAATPAEAIDAFEALDHRALIDGSSTDAEDDLDICGAGMDEEAFDDALRDKRCIPVQDLDAVINAQAGTVAHLANGWYLWQREDAA